jgi:hypothetical protein
MAIGDAAAAAGFDLFSDTMDADQIATAMNQILDYLAPLKVAIDGATANGTADNAGKLVQWGSGGRLNMANPVNAAHGATKAYVDGA